MSVSLFLFFYKRNFSSFRFISVFAAFHLFFDSTVPAFLRLNRLQLSNCLKDKHHHLNLILNAGNSTRYFYFLFLWHAPFSLFYYFFLYGFSVCIYMYVHICMPVREHAFLLVHVFLTCSVHF